MNITTSRVRGRHVAGMLAVATLVAAAPAAAGNSNRPETFHDRFSGSYADAWFVATDDGTDGDGNYHEGYVSAYSTQGGGGEAFVSVVNWECEEGRTPYDGWFFDEETGEEFYDEGCEFLSEDFGWTDMIGFDLDRRLTSASITGEVELYDFDWETGEETMTGTITLDVALEGIGELDRGMFSFSYQENGYSERFRDMSTSREAAVSGTIGGIDLSTADEAGGYMVNFRSQSHFRFRG